MEEHDKAWLAAALDAEGSLNRPPRTRIVIYNSCLPFLEKARALVGGVIRSHPSWKTNVQTYMLDVAAGRERVAEVLRLIRPYLIIKAERADAILAWIATIPTVEQARAAQWEAARCRSPPRRPGGWNHTPETRAKLREVWARRKADPTWVNPLKGRTRPLGERVGYRHSPETIEKLRAAARRRTKPKALRGVERLRRDRAQQLAETMA
jgi:hypothetical protein